MLFRDEHRGDPHRTSGDGKEHLGRAIVIQVGLAAFQQRRYQRAHGRRPWDRRPPTLQIVRSCEHRDSVSVAPTLSRFRNVGPCGNLLSRAACSRGVPQSPRLNQLRAHPDRPSLRQQMSHTDGRLKRSRYNRYRSRMQFHQSKFVAVPLPGKKRPKKRSSGHTRERGIRTFRE